jgi:ribosomal protein S18 acetylase RimI-like enzyme
VKRELEDGIELDDDKARVDLVAVHAYLTQSYWAEGRTHDEVATHLADAARPLGLYRGSRQIGYARVAIDDRGAGLYDVYVEEEFRGRGLGVELVREAVESPAHAALAWRLKTRDAHGLYERFGFVRTGEREMARPRLS